MDIYISAQLEYWRNSSDLPLISGTIQRAFTDTQTISLDYVQANDAVIPTVDRNIMWQINNCNIFKPDSASLDITQDPVRNIILFNPSGFATSLTGMLSVAKSDFVLNSFDGNTSDEFIMESTRLISFTNEVGTYAIVPTEFVSACTIYYVKLDTSTNLDTIASFPLVSAITTKADSTIATGVSWLTQMGVLSQFKYHPRVDFYHCISATPDATHMYELQCTFGDLYKFTTINNSALAGLYRAATQSVYKTYIKGSLGNK